MAEAIVLRVAKLLDDFPKDGKLWDVGGEFDQLKKTVSFLQRIVPDAEKRSLRDMIITGWLARLKDAFYDAEDLLEELNIEVARRESLSNSEKLKQQVSPSFSPSRKHDSMPEASVRARDIRDRIEAIAVRGRSLDLRERAEDVQVERGSRNRERSDSFVYDEDIIGREDDKSAIMKFLLDSDTNEQISVLSIWGKNGIGKTALVRCLYEDDMVKKHFDLRIWVCGAKIFNLQRILGQINRSETTERADDMKQLQNQLKEHIRGKKYLLVMEDLWTQNREQWWSLKSLLIGGAQGSKILITTHSQSVADLAGTTPSYRLEALPENFSLDLLMRMACKEEEETRDSNKINIRRQIVKKCYGMPLAIRVIGSLLFFKKTEAEWYNFADEMSEISEDLSDFTIPKLSYDHLPSHLKQCFAFCSLFPYNGVIDKQLLTSLWMAEGFIQPIDNVDQDMEDIAHDYFMELLRRNLFQDCIEDELGNVRSCKMHGLLYTIACFVSAGEYHSAMGGPSLNNVERVRHVSLNSTSILTQGLPTLLRAKHLRTFIRINEAETSGCEPHVGEKALCEFISTFKFLRALDWHDSGIEKLPSSIGELKHLTFLDLSENEGIVRLPDTMTRLQTLQVLKLNKCCKLMELPRDIRKLVNLRHLEISDCSALSHMPSGLDQLTLLHTLTDFLLPGDDSCREKYSGLGELSRLSNLRGSLRIEVKGQIKDGVANSNSANLKERDYLVSLVLVFHGKESDEILLQQLQPSLNLRSLEIRGYGGTRFPSWMSCMPKLVQLRLFDCAACKSFPSLGELTSLKHLEIGELPIAEYTESDIHALSSLGNLSTLMIWECPILKRIPPLVQLKRLKPPNFPLQPLRTFIATTEHIIDIDDRVKDVIQLLEIENDEVGVRIVGIHGTNGMGKTTIAKAVYDRLSSCFDSCSFLAEIGETAQNGGIQFVQTKLIRDILERDGDVASFEGEIKFFLDVFSNIKALIVLDDVEEQSHLDDLVGNQLEWFGPGSRIIVTSENRGILETCVSRGRANIYEVNKMDNDQALELFCKHASITWYPEIGKRIVKATGLVPFVIEVISSLLRGKTMEDWRKMEDLIKPHSQEILKDCREISKICYEFLDEKQKQIFWDIARFANGVDSQIASYMWSNLDLLPSYQVLMPLAKIGEDNMLWMHKLLKSLSRTIDQEERKYPVKRRRLYINNLDLKVINKEEGMQVVEALGFDSKNLSPDTFTETLLNARFLKLDHASMTGNFPNVLPKLRWLRWQGCPRDFKATELNLTELVILDLSQGKITEDWGGWWKIKTEQLKVLNLTSCTDLLISPKFSSFPNLEILILKRCSRLVHLDPSIGCLKKLLCLNLKSCTELNSLPANLGALKALKELLIDETSVCDIPLGGDLKELETLSASNCLSLSLPDVVGELEKLRCLSLRNCHWIQRLPESIGQSPLEELDISGTGISELPGSFNKLQSLRVLKMNYCFIRKFPSFIWHLHSLEELHASLCRNIEGEIPGDIVKLKNLRILRLRNSAISMLPPGIEHLSKLETLDLLHCDKLHELPALPSSLVIVHLSPKLKEKVSDLLMKKHCFLTV